MERIFHIGLRVDKEIVRFLDSYHYGTRSEVVRNLLYERIEFDNPVLAFQRLLMDYEEDVYDSKTFIKRFLNMKRRYREAMIQYTKAIDEIEMVERSGMLNGIMGRIKLSEESLTRWIR